MNVRGAIHLADDTDVGDEVHKAGPIAIVVIIALCIACFFLFRSMSKHMRTVREQFPEPAARPAAGPAARAGGPTGSAGGPTGSAGGPTGSAGGPTHPGAAAGEPGNSPAPPPRSSR